MPVRRVSGRDDTGGKTPPQLEKTGLNPVDRRCRVLEARDGGHRGLGMFNPQKISVAEQCYML